MEFGNLEHAIKRAQSVLLQLQHPEGYWLGELEANSTLCADYIAFTHWAGEVEPGREKRCVDHLLEWQLEDGGWSIYRGGPARLDPSLKAYFALKLAGLKKDDPRLVRAAAVIRDLGGIASSRYYTRFYLALLGQVSWSDLPAIPVELVLLPNSFPINLYSLSAWTRAMVVPMAITHHFAPTRPVPSERGISELDLPDDGKKTPRQGNWFSGVIVSLNCLQRCGLVPSRDSALLAAKRWMLERLNLDGNGLGAIFPSIIQALIALRCLGHDLSSSVYRKAEKAIEGLFLDDPKGLRIQPCLSPVWDTAITGISLIESGLAPSHPALQKAMNWLMRHRVTTKGDWAVNDAGVEPSAWSFQFKNTYYPDFDDTAMVMLALHATGVESREIIQKSLDWLLSVQSGNGGWAAFDKDAQNPILRYLPFADHRAILDPSCADITGRVLEVLSKFRITITDLRVRKAIQFLRKNQEPEGCWYGRWGVNYVYGTAQVLRGIRSVGVDMNQAWVQKAGRWLEAHQNEDGGWGESCASYTDPIEKGRGESTASQTAWALIGLTAFPEAQLAKIDRGIAWLLERQKPDGVWDEDMQTGTGFPGVLYLRYDYYRIYWPLRALAIYASQQTVAKRDLPSA